MGRFGFFLKSNFISPPFLLRNESRSAVRIKVLHVLSFVLSVNRQLYEVSPPLILIVQRGRQALWLMAKRGEAQTVGVQIVPCTEAMMFTLKLNTCLDKIEMQVRTSSDPVALGRSVLQGESHSCGLSLQ